MKAFSLSLSINFSTYTIHIYETRKKFLKFMMKNSTENLVSSVRQDIFPRLKQEALNDNTELLIIFASRFRRPDVLLSAVVLIRDFVVTLHSTVVT